MYEREESGTPESSNLEAMHARSPAGRTTIARARSTSALRWEQHNVCSRIAFARICSGGVQSCCRAALRTPSVAFGGRLDSRPRRYAMTPAVYERTCGPNPCLLCRILGHRYRRFEMYVRFAHNVSSPASAGPFSGRGTVVSIRIPGGDQLCIERAQSHIFRPAPRSSHQSLPRSSARLHITRYLLLSTLARQARAPTPHRMHSCAAVESGAVGHNARAVFKLIHSFPVTATVATSTNTGPRITSSAFPVLKQSNTVRRARQRCAPGCRARRPSPLLVPNIPAA